MVLDPWSHSATLDGALLNGLLHAEHNSDEPGDDELEAGREAAREEDWANAAEHYDNAAGKGNLRGLTLLADCIYKGRGTRQNRTEAVRMWKLAAKEGDILAMLALGDDRALHDNNGQALIWYRSARKTAAGTPDIDHTPLVCLRMAQYETRYTSRKKALALAAEAQQGFAVLAREHRSPRSRQPMTWNLYNWTKTASYRYDTITGKMNFSLTRLRAGQLERKQYE